MGIRRCAVHVARMQQPEVVGCQLTLYHPVDGTLTTAADDCMDHSYRPQFLLYLHLAYVLKHKSCYGPAGVTIGYVAAAIQDTHAQCFIEQLDASLSPETCPPSLILLINRCYADLSWKQARWHQRVQLEVC